MIKKNNDVLFVISDKVLPIVITYIKDNVYLINFLFAAIMVAYGFELFNFNLTIDEEIHAFYNGPTVAWIEQGRWGMYFLNKFLLPYTIVPVIPLLLALMLHLMSVLLMLDSWNVNSKLDRVVLGTLGISFPTIAYAYTFSTFNYGIGFGFLCVALSAFLYSKSSDQGKLMAIIPAMFSLAIYQGFISALAVVFLVHIVSSMLLPEKSVLKEIVYVLFIIVCAVAAYYLIQKLAVLLFNVTESGYVWQYLDLDALRGDFLSVFSRLWNTAISVYRGDKAVYSIDIPMLDALFMAFSLGIVWRLFHSKTPVIKKISALFLIACIVLLPLSLGFLSRGIMGLRAAVAFPIAVAGFGALGMRNLYKPFRLFIAFIAGVCFLQFTVATNHLFASSHLSLQADRLLAAQIIDEIQEAKEIAGIKDVRYLHIVGQMKRPPTELMPKIDTFGASFFEWDGGNVGRIILFLNTIGYNELSFLPAIRQAEMIQFTESMPTWPEKGSVNVVNDTVLVKFDTYSFSQISQICNSTQNHSLIPQGFCP